MLRHSQPGTGRFLAVPGLRPCGGDRDTRGGRRWEGVKARGLGGKPRGEVEARACSREAGVQPGAAGTRSLGAAHGHGASWKPKAKGGQTHRRNIREMDTTPSLGITDQFPAVAGLGPGEVSCLGFPSRETGSGAASTGVKGWRCPGRTDRTAFPVLVRRQLRVAAEDSSVLMGKGIKSSGRRSREAETLKSP